MLRVVCVILGYDLPIQLMLKLLSSECHDRLVDHFHRVATDSPHELRNMQHFMLEQILSVWTITNAYKAS